MHLPVSSRFFARAVTLGTPRHPLAFLRSLPLRSRPFPLRLRQHGFRKSLAACLPIPLLKISGLILDFTADTLADGRAFRMLNIVDGFTRECVAIEVERSLPGLRVTRASRRLLTSSR